MILPETVTDAVRGALAAGADILTVAPDRAPLMRSRVARRRLARLRARLFAVLQELPDDMTIAELRDELAPGGAIAQED